MTLQVTSLSVGVQRTSAIGFSRGGILQHTNWLHILCAISFLPCPGAYWQLPIPLPRFSGFFLHLVPDLSGERGSSRWGWGSFTLPGSPRSSDQSLLCTSVICFRQCLAQVSYCLVVSLSPCCICGLSFNTKLPGARHNEFSGTTSVGLQGS